MIIKSHVPHDILKKTPFNFIIRFTHIEFNNHKIFISFIFRFQVMHYLEYIMIFSYIRRPGMNALRVINITCVSTCFILLASTSRQPYISHYKEKSISYLLSPTSLYHIPKFSHIFGKNPVSCRPNWVTS